MCGIKLGRRRCRVRGKKGKRSGSCEVDGILVANVAILRKLSTLPSS